MFNEEFIGNYILPRDATRCRKRTGIYPKLCG